MLFRAFKPKGRHTVLPGLTIIVLAQDKRYHVWQGWNCKLCPLPINRGLVWSFDHVVVL